MPAYDARGQATAARMLAPIAQGGKGQVVTITTPFVGTFDPATQTTTTGAATTQTGSGVTDTYSSFSTDGTLIQSGDLKLLLSPFKADGTPITKPVADQGTVTLADGSVWAIKKVDPLAPAGTVIMFTLQLRGVG